MINNYVEYVMVNKYVEYLVVNNYVEYHNLDMFYTIRRHLLTRQVIVCSI